MLSTKWNGGFHRRTPSVELGSDSSGTWLWMQPGCIAETRLGPYEASAGLRLIPVGQTWSAYFVPSFPAVSQPESIYVDVSTPNKRIGDVFTFVDLDLAVEVIGDGPVTVLDRDEFTAHAQAWRYPHETVTTAETTFHRVAAALANCESPFDGSYLGWWKAAQL